MDFNRINENHDARVSRGCIPKAAFWNIYKSSHTALYEISVANFSAEVVQTIARSHILTTVTAIEVFYRDSFVSILKYAKPSEFIPKLKHIHKQKYDVGEIYNLYIEEISPLKLVVDSINFQNSSSINRVFSDLLGENFFNIALRNFMSKEVNGEKIDIQVENGDLEILDWFFKERHKLTHNPKFDQGYDVEELLTKLESLQKIILASDLAMLLFINKYPAIDVDNPDPKVIERISKEWS